MSAFDPYHKWLGIPPAEQPPHHYRLLGVAPFESDLDVIESAADRQMTYIRGCATGPNLKESQQILNELSAARLCLLNPSKKQAYDSELKARIAPPPAPAPAPPSVPVVVTKEAAGGLPPAPTGAPKKPETTNPADISHQERRARKLLDEQDFDAVIPILVKLAELPGTLYKTTAVWAAAELPKAKQKQEKLRDRVRAACEKARELMKTYNYAEVTQLLEALPGPARSDEARSLLEQAGQNYEDSLGLQQEIDNAVKNKNYERLLPLVKRFLKLKPDSVRMQTLARNLARNSPERAARYYKGTGKYFDVAGRLVEVKELAMGVFLIAGLVVGAVYGAKYLRQIPAAGELLSSSKGPSGGPASSASEAEKSSSKTSAKAVPTGDSAKANPTAAGIGPPPGVAPKTAAATSGAKDDSTDDSPQPIAEEWTKADEWLVSPGNPTAVYALPDHPPEEYTVSLRARRLTGKNTFAIGIPVGEKQVLVALDAHQGTVSGLEFLDGKHVNNNEATRRGRLLLPDREATIKCTVRKEGISCTCEGVRFLDWRGDLGQLSVPPDFAVPDKKALFIATIGSRVAIREIKVSPPEKLSSAAWEAEANALVGTWAPARGLSREGLKERWEVRNTNGDWSVKRSFTDKSGKAVGASASENCKFSGGVLKYTDRFSKKPAGFKLDSATTTLQLDSGNPERLEMHWFDGAVYGGGEKLVRPNALAAIDAEADKFAGSWRREDGGKDALSERWEIRKTKGEWSVKRTFVNKMGKVVGYSVSENCTSADGTLKYTERLKQKPASNLADVCDRTLQFESSGSGRIEAIWSIPGRSGKEVLARTSTK